MTSISGPVFVVFQNISEHHFPGYFRCNSDSIQSNTSSTGYSVLRRRRRSTVCSDDSGMEELGFLEMIMQKARSSNISGQDADDDSKNDFEDHVLGTIHLELARYHEGKYLQPPAKWRVTVHKVCIKSPCTVSKALLALIEVHGLLIQSLLGCVNTSASFLWPQGRVHATWYLSFSWGLYIYMLKKSSINANKEYRRK